MQYFQQLHDIGAIQEIFSVLIHGGIKSRFSKTLRLNNASSVQAMNQVLLDFVKTFTKPSLLARISTWPTILLGEKTCHPVLGEDRIIEKLKGTGMQVMSLGSDFTFDENIYSGAHSVVNGKGEIVAIPQGNFKIFKPSGESRILCLAPREDHASECYVMAMNIDAENNLYFITSFLESDDELWSFKLFIFDKNGSKKLESPLPFHQRSSFNFFPWWKIKPKLCMAINKDGKIAILNCKSKILYIGNICVELNSFKIDKIISLDELYVEGFLSASLLGFSDFNGTKIIAADCDTVYIYTEDGQAQRKIKIPEGQGFIESGAINYVTKHILVKTYRPLGSSLLSFSDTGELIDSLCLGSSAWIRVVSYADLL